MSISPRLPPPTPDDAIRAELARLRRQVNALERGQTSKRIYADSGPPTPDLPDGALYVRMDTTPERLYVRVNGQWTWFALARSAWGHDTASVGGANSAQKTIAHTLPDTPSNIHVTVNDLGNAGPLGAVGGWVSKGPSQFDAQIKHRDAGTNFGAGTTIGFDWLAIL